jgi:CheY-like chemotaxis protein
VKTVLILDDDNAVRDSLIYYFEDRGWSVLPATSAEEALDILQHKMPDGAVVDIRLPGMDGNEFIRLACKIHTCLAYVIVTGSPEYRLPEDVRTMPPVSDNVFSKPVVKLHLLEEALLHQIDQCTE